MSKIFFLFIKIFHKAQQHTEWRLSQVVDGRFPQIPNRIWMGCQHGILIQPPRAEFFTESEVVFGNENGKRQSL